MEQSLAISISDRATDEVIEALTRCRRGLDISDSQTVSFETAETPDIVRSRSSQDSMGFAKLHSLDLPHRNLDSPTVSDFLSCLMLALSLQSCMEHLTLFLQLDFRVFFP